MGSGFYELPSIAGGSTRSTLVAASGRVRFFIYDFFVFLHDKSGSYILTIKLRKCNIPKT